MIEDGALKKDFKTELLGTYPKKECLDKETELAVTSLFPKGLNGNAGRYIEQTEEVREKMSKNALKRIEEGTHNLLDGDIQRKSNQKRVADGTHHFLDGEFQRKSNRKRVENGTHHFLGGEIQRKSNRKRVADGTHNFLGGEISRKNAIKRAKNCTHNFLRKVSVLNIETGEKETISTELYHSRKDIYFHSKSKVYKEWKKKKTMT